MKTKLCLLVFLLAATFVHAQTNNLTSLLQQGLLEEQANRNFDAAISNYQSLAVQFEKDRQLAATAIFRLGECYRMQGKTNEAALDYQRILRDFPDQTALATLSRQDLAGMGYSLSVKATAGTEPSNPLPVSSEAGVLAAQIPGIEKLKSVQERGLAVQAIFPDDNLKKMLLQLPKLQAQEAMLNSNPQLTYDQLTRNQGYAIAVGGGDVVLDGFGADVHTNLLAEAEGEVKKQNAWIEQRVDFILGTQKARLKVLKSMAGAEIAQSASQTEATPVGTDEEAQEIQRIQTMIQNSPDLINAPGEGGKTSLAQAASKGWLKVTAYLIEHGADVNGSGGGALFDATGAGNRAMVEFLLAHGADVNANRQNGDSPLALAARKGFQAVTETLLASHADVNAHSLSGATSLALTPLVSAVQGGHLKIVQMLLAAGAKVNLKDSKGETALNYAIGISPEVFQALLDAGADPNTEDVEGRTPLSHAAEKDGPQVLKMLLAAKADPKRGKLDAPLLCAIREHDAASAELLLQAGANPNAKGEVDWQMPVGGVVYYGGEINRASVTPLWMAVLSKQLPLVQLLLKFKADWNDPRTDGRPLLFTALSDTNILEALLDAGAKVDARGTAYDWTPLSAAAYDDDVGAVRILLEHGANPNASSAYGDTGLHIAADIQRLTPEIFELLLDHHANPNMRNNQGKTPLEILKGKMASSSPADQKTASQLADLLRQHGAMDVLPDWDCISVSRPSANFSTVIFRKGTNDWNQFTLFDLLGVQYDLLDASIISRAGPVSPSFPYGVRQIERSSLTFPDFRRIVIHRPSASGTNWTDLKTSLARAFDTGDCAANVPLQFGDVVEIPEADHVINEHWAGLTTNELFTLKGCLTRHFQITVNGKTASVTIAPQVEVIMPGSHGYVFSGGPEGLNGGRGVFGPIENMPPEISLTKFEPCMIWPVLENSKLLLASSDLSRVTVKRRDSVTGKTRQWTVDCSNSDSPANFWLRDGDVVEVPEKP